MSSHPVDSQQSPPVQVDFYVLQSKLPESRNLFVARLSEKLFKLGHTVWIWVESESEAISLDETLWSHPPEAFIPHSIHPPGPEELTQTSISLKTHISCLTPNPGSAEVIINLNSEAVLKDHGCKRLVEVVNQQPEVLSGTRKHFKAYRERGYSIQSHNLNS